VLHPRAKLDRIADETGEALEFLRDHIRSRARYLDNEMHDTNVVVLLGEPARQGEQVELSFEYELEILNYARCSNTRCRETEEARLQRRPRDSRKRPHRSDTHRFM
jgi:hypothetical protein